MVLPVDAQRTTAKVPVTADVQMRPTAARNVSTWVTSVSKAITKIPARPSDGTQKKVAHLSVSHQFQLPARIVTVWTSSAQNNTNISVSTNTDGTHARAAHKRAMHQLPVNAKNVMGSMLSVARNTSIPVKPLNGIK